jgi:hypothetical protein
MLKMDPQSLQRMKKAVRLTLRASRARIHRKAIHRKAWASRTLRLRPHLRVGEICVPES